jgi:uncharacterized membrane protein (UPF0127 family)
MPFKKWISSIWSSTAHRRRSAAIPSRVINLTRQTVLADRLEVANQGATRRKGLLGRSGLEAGEGLWIQPCEAVHTFFMNFPIDLIYLDRAHRIRKVRKSVPAWRLSACLSASSVLELPSGCIEATQSRRGDKLDFCSAEFNTGEAGA